MIATIEAVNDAPAIRDNGGSPPSITATTELVVPRSMPMICSCAELLYLASLSGRRATTMISAPLMSAQ